MKSLTETYTSIGKGRSYCDRSSQSGTRQINAIVLIHLTDWLVDVYAMGMLGHL